MKIILFIFWSVPESIQICLDCTGDEVVWMWIHFPLGGMLYLHFLALITTNIPHYTIKHGVEFRH